MTDFDLPTLSEARARYRDAFAADLDGADTLLAASNLRVVGDVLGDADFELAQYLAMLADEMMVDKAQAWLERHGNQRGIYRKSASTAAGTVTVTGKIGGMIEAGDEAVAKDGTVLVATVGLTLEATTAPLAVEAKETGAAGNLAAGVKVSFTRAIVDVDAEATVAGTAGLSGGADIEDIEDYRERILEYMREPPMGGDENDYVKWAKEVPGVTRAWVYPKEMGLGTVTLRFMMDKVRAAFDGIPQGTTASTLAAGDGDQQTVFDYIVSRRPVTADLFVVAPIPDAIDVTIADLSTDTPAVRADIAANIADAIRRDSKPGGITRASRIDEAVSIATGEDWHTLVAPAGNVTHATGHIAIPGSITYE